MRPSLFRKTLAAGLALICVLAQAALADLSQSTLWEQRRASRSTPTQLASLPLALPPLAKSHPVFHPGLSPALQASLAALRQDCVALGEVRSVGARPPVIVLQDIHRNAEAQKNLQSAVAALMESTDVGSVHLEGAFGDLHLESFRAFSLPTRRALLDALVDINAVGGPTAAAVLSSRLPALRGADDEPAYRRNVEAVRAAALLRPGALKRIGELSRRTDIRKKAA